MFGVQVRVIRVRQYVVESHETCLDRLRLVLPAIPAVGIADGLVKGLVLKMVYVTVVLEDVPPDVSAAYELLEENGGSLAMLYLNGRIELSGNEITAVAGNAPKEPGFLRRVPQRLDRQKSVLYSVH